MMHRGNIGLRGRGNMVRGGINIQRGPRPGYQGRGYLNIGAGRPPMNSGLNMNAPNHNTHKSFPRGPPNVGSVGTNLPPAKVITNVSSQGTTSVENVSESSKSVVTTLQSSDQANLSNQTIGSLKSETSTVVSSVPLNHASSNISSGESMSSSGPQISANIPNHPPPVQSVKDISQVSKNNKSSGVPTNVPSHAQNKRNDMKFDSLTGHQAKSHNRQRGPPPKRSYDGRIGTNRPDQDRKFERPRQRSGSVNDSFHGDSVVKSDKVSVKEEKPRRKYPGKCRLFVGNLPIDMGEGEFRKLFEGYGDILEVFVGKGFGFVRMTDKYGAEKAKDAVDGLSLGNRVVRCRYATHGAAIKVKNIPPFVSNELLEEAFSQFGPLERAIVIADDKGKPIGEGIVEFVRKPAASAALQRMSEGVFLMGSSPRPIVVDPLEQQDDEDGYPERFMFSNQMLDKDRESGCRFARPGTFEYEWGLRWKQMDEMEKTEIERVKKEMAEMREKLSFEMEDAYQDYQTQLMRQDLMRREEQLRMIEERRAAEQERRRQQFETRFGHSDAQHQGMNPRAEMPRPMEYDANPLHPPPVPPMSGNNTIPTRMPHTDVPPAMELGNRDRMSGNISNMIAIRGGMSLPQHPCQPTSIQQHLPPRPNMHDKPIQNTSLPGLLGAGQNIPPFPQDFGQMRDRKQGGFEFSAPQDMKKDILDIKRPRRF